MARIREPTGRTTEEARAVAALVDDRDKSRLRDERPRIGGSVVSAPSSPSRVAAV